jgi:hypothetical protein
LALVAVGVTVLLLIAHSSRLADLHTNLLVGGVSSESNRELARFAQILYPLQQFPRIYQPPILFSFFVMEPMGLLPLAAGYGSVFGVAWLAYILRRNFPLRRLPLRPLALVAGLMLLVFTAPDFIPAVVAFAVFMVPPKQNAAPPSAAAES